MSDPSPNAPFDDLLAEARWPEPSADAMQRVEAAWCAVTPAVSRFSKTSRRLTWAAVAAGITVVLAWIALESHKPQRSPRPQAGIFPVDQAPAPPAEETVIPSRPPTPMELAFMKMPAQPVPPRRPIQAQVVLKDAPPKPLTFERIPRGDKLARQQWLTGLLTADRADDFLRYVRNPLTRADALDAAAGAPRVPLERFLSALDDERFDVRLAAARVLGRIDGPITTAALVKRVHERPHREQALIALLFSDGAEAQSFVQSARKDPLLAGLVRSLEVEKVALQ